MNGERGMDAKRTATQQAYTQIRDQIVTLTLAPGARIDEQRLAQDLHLDVSAVHEALTLLAHDDLLKIDPQYGIHVSDVHLADLEQLHTMRLALESLCARLAAQRATPDDLVVLETLRQEYDKTAIEQPQRLLEVDHSFHQAVAQAAHNTYLAETLEHFFGLSQRLWYLVLPHLSFLPSAVEEHLMLLEAIKAGDSNRAEQIMHDHVEGFYTKVRNVLTITVTVSYGSHEESVTVEEQTLLSAAIMATGLPLEQPCGGRGTCGKCKVLVEGSLTPPDATEQQQLSAAELAAGYRLACR
ncbi:FCD domain-containing protein, partial [candidate division KSB3 bacterium]|nr:FCD domain-containing protein [candidate division KSB3 bacterium]MBD3324537.1 FCD domain-containing protein [candidate division KSB3 bacterium]